ncbi:MAG: DUF309 domain-containing protein [Desulfobacterales bacterium]|nr:DUF309 domain-containing protein [Desulfobacterales bacterium]MDJ0856226.1 DUF309 domain-containing protein [Desulfobacterales bacterium]MDJ0886623.1 DUF309 domain-containing protein [Desulfobacterales bacterium]
MGKEKAKITSSPLSEQAFDPFRDRASRDIRNALSEAFVAAWQEDGTDYESLAAELRRRHAQPVYQTYIDRRLADYRAAFEERRKFGAPDLVAEMVVLWNRKLFFEVHELLESHWHEAREERREVLKTLIQAAAVYVHREAGRLAAAKKMGRRVSSRLDALRAHLAAIRNLDALREALADPAEPPRLKGRLR